MNEQPVSGEARLVEELNRCATTIVERNAEVERLNRELDQRVLDQHAGWRFQLERADKAEAEIERLRRAHDETHGNLMRHAAALTEERDSLREDIEDICEALIELGGWEEIDGDGSEGSVIVDHIRSLVRGDTPKAEAQLDVSPTPQHYAVSDQDEDTGAVVSWCNCGGSWPCPQHAETTP